MSSETISFTTEQAERLEELSLWLQEKFGLKSWDLEVAPATIKSVQNDDRIEATDLLGQCSVGRPNSTGAMYRKAKIELLVDNLGDDIEKYEKTLIHEFIHIKFWRFAPVSSKESPIHETDMEEFIIDMANTIFEGWKAIRAVRASEARKGSGARPTPRKGKRARHTG